MLPIVAEVLNRNEFDTEFLGKFIQVVLTLAAVWGAYAVGKRKPSMDVDVTKLDQRLVTAEQSIKRLFAHRDEIQQSLTDLKTGQATNTANIQDIKDGVHEIRNELAQAEALTQRKMDALTGRIDQVLMQELHNKRGSGR